jgi:hypothetical protein
MPGFKRKLFYFGGFDPRGARHYHALLAGEIAGDATRGGAIRLGPRRPHGAGVAWSITTPDCACEQVFLGWDDIVRAHWVRAPLAVWWRSMVAYWGFIARLDWRIGRRFARGSLRAFYGPGLAMFALVPLVGVLAGAVVARLGGGALWLAPLAGAGAAGAVVAALLALWRLHGFWMLRFAIFNDAWLRGRVGAALDQRLDAFAQTIVQALAQGDDEVLLVTHSNGSILAMPLLDRLLTRYGGQLPARFALVTLGGSIPLMGARRDAGALRAVFDRIARAHVRWLDLCSPTDGACLPRLDPFVGRGRSAPSGFERMNPLWYRYCAPAAYRARRRDKYRVHFDYLRRMDRASPLDFLSLATAPRPLAASIAAFRQEHG